MSFLANAIRVARTKRGWKQVELGDKLQVTQSTVSFWENGVEIPSLSHQLQLIDVMPDILNALVIQELNLLDRVQTLERIVFDGKCSCEGCSCSGSTPIKPLSKALMDSSDAVGI